MKALLTAILLTVLCANSYAETEKNVGRQRVNIDFDWLFYLGDDAEAKQSSFADQNWRKLDLPHDWSIEGEYQQDNPAGYRGGFLPTGIAWYRKHLQWDERWRDKHVEIEFDGVYMNSEVYINGHLLGKRPYGYIGFVYDLSQYLKPGDNVISVRVDHSKAPSGRWYTGSGIYRHVWLTTKAKVHIPYSGTWVRSENVSETQADLMVTTEISNRLAQAQQVMLSTEVIDDSGQIVALLTTPVALPAGVTKSTEQKFTIKNPKLWSVDQAKLYTVRSKISQNQRLLDNVDTSTGIRNIEISAARGFVLNGKPLILQGAGMHHDAGPVGSAVPDDVLRGRLIKLKAMGVNAIRTTHNPFAPEFYQMADEMGFVVMNEAFDGWWTPKAKFDYGLYFDKWWQRDLEDFIKRDRNHPSVVMWSIGNEVPKYTSEQQKRIKTFVEQLDSTRAITQGRGYAGGHLDIAGFNGHGEYLNAMPDFHQEYPNLPAIGTEMTHTMHTRGVYRSKTRYRTRDNPAPWEVQNNEKKWQALKPSVYPLADFTETEVFPEANIKYGSSFDNSVVRMPIREEIRLARDLPYLLGTFRWTAFDYIGESFGWPARTANFGVLDLAGFPKGVYYLYQSQWAKAPMVHLDPHWTHPGKAGIEIPVVVYSNQYSVELLLNGHSLGEKIMTDEMQLLWKVPYQSGTLTAIAKNANGKVIVKDIVQTAGKATGLAIKADKTMISANRRDVVHLEIDIVDDKGVMLPSANNLVTINIEGPGRLIGVENGDILDLAPHKVPTRKAFMGKVLALVQATDQSGDIEVTISAASLTSQHITIVAH
ncbi:glycoside hydrolase family 2 TIM barrel-domain containing protein [Thalassotalea fonticola]|uniref:Glycoside hydrolase family 2 TIM barrel-domain containing protein n=1 Tax=Thalassotalea fonticola TaxID=3065649 RepID=A0ABZ0GLL6_9GAMM|nr:glycoside hydrolase family 2 TIM barrel-domain containing protein [Colwelliaceae bacterium S1-1]